MVKVKKYLLVLMGVFPLMTNAAETLNEKKSLPGPYESRQIYNQGKSQSYVIKEESKKLLYNSIKMNDSMVRSIRASMKPYGSVLVVLDPMRNKREALTLVDEAVGREWNDCANVVFNGHGSPVLNAIYNSLMGYMWGDGRKRYKYIRTLVEHSKDIVKAAKSRNPIDAVLKQIDYVFYDFPIGAKEALKIQLKSIYNTKGPHWLVIGQKMYDDVDRSALILNNPHSVVFPEEYGKINNIILKNRKVCKNTTNEWVRPDKNWMEKEYQRRNKTGIPLDY